MNSRIENLRIANAWILCALSDSEGDADQYEWASGELLDLIGCDPPRAIDIMVLIAQESNDSRVLDLLGAGPIEAILYDYGIQFVPRLIREARNSKGFLTAIHAVWIDEFPEARRLIRDALGW